MKHIKINENHDSTIIYQVCKSNEDKQMTEADCEAIYNGIREFGVSEFHQSDYDKGYRIRVWRYNGYVYITYALQYANTSEERIIMQELEAEHLSDAKKIAKFFVKNYENFLMHEEVVDCDA